MASVVFQNVRRVPQGEPVAVRGNMRRLSTITKRYANERRPFTITDLMVHHQLRIQPPVNRVDTGAMDGHNRQKSASAADIQMSDPGVVPIRNEEPLSLSCRPLPITSKCMHTTPEGKTGIYSRGLPITGITMDVT